MMDCQCGFDPETGESYCTLLGRWGVSDEECERARSEREYAMCEAADARRKGEEL